MKSHRSSLLSEAKNSAICRDWSSLPTELLAFILQKLIYDFMDTIRFKAVCNSWRLVPFEIPRNPPPQLPWLILSSDKKSTTRRSFFSLSDARCYTLAVPESWSESGSSHGWLFMEDGSKLFSLLNPITKVWTMLPEVKFPSPELKNQKFIMKGVLSSDPQKLEYSDACWIAVIVGGDNFLAISKLGKNRWTFGVKSVDDVVYFNRQFYAVTCFGQILVYDPRATRQVRRIEGPEESRAHKTYLVELLGELLMVRRFRPRSLELKKVNKTFKFKIWRQDVHNKKWEGVTTLGCWSLFLGHNHSLSVLASDYSGCRGNCIYFTDNCSQYFAGRKAEPHDVGVFDLGNGSIEQLPGYYCDTQFIRQRPFWITPSPW